MIYNSLEEASVKVEEYKHKLNKLKELEGFGFDFDCRNIRVWYVDNNEEIELLVPNDFTPPSI